MWQVQGDAAAAGRASAHGPCSTPFAAAQPRRAALRRPQRLHVAGASEAPPSSSSTASQAPEVVGVKSVVVLGGTGRVGASTAAALARALPSCTLSLAGRSQDSFTAAKAARPELGAASFRRCDVDDPASIAAALAGADLVIHCAGPFQRREDCYVLEAAIAGGVPYLDVCDDTAYSQRAKRLHAKAQAAGVPAITTAGIYPGRGPAPHAYVRAHSTQAWSRCCADAAPTRRGAALLQA